MRCRRKFHARIMVVELEDYQAKINQNPYHSPGRQSHITHMTGILPREKKSVSPHSEYLDQGKCVIKKNI